MSKRKAPEPSASAKASGKQKLTPDLAHMDSQDLLSNLLAGDDDENQGLALPSADDLGVGGEEDDDDGLAEALFDGDDLGDDDGADAPAAADDDEVGELPEGLEESHLTDPEEVDLSKLELTPPQARRVAQLLAQNSSLAKLKVEGASLDLSDLQDDELEWDSEEYGDVFAIIIAELLKSNETIQRLDLCRNQIGDAGAVALAQMLLTNTTLEYLNLESNQFGERAGIAFCGAVCVNSTLTYLNLKENSVPSAIGDDLREGWIQSRPDGHGVGLHY